MEGVSKEGGKANPESRTRLGIGFVYNEVVGVKEIDKRGARENKWAESFEVTTVLEARKKHRL